MNAFRCERGIKICVDLAGIDQSEIELEIEPRRIGIRGYRQAPEPSQEEELIQILAMEIDHGRFERELLLPLLVDVDQVAVEQRNGFLWIWLPSQSGHPKETPPV